MAIYYKQGEDLYYDGTNKLVPDNVKFKEGDIVYCYDDMPIDKFGYHATGKYIIEKNILGMLVEKACYDVDGEEMVI